MPILTNDITVDDLTWHWSIGSMTRLRNYQELTDVVISVNVGLTGIWRDPDYADQPIDAGSHTFNVNVTWPSMDNISVENYTNFNDLTESQVMTWCMERLTEDQISNVKQMIVEEIKHRRTWVDSAPPWIAVNPPVEQDAAAE